MTERRIEPRDAAGAPAAPRGFRPPSRRRARLAAGAVVAAVGIGGNVLLYTSLDDSVEVVQVVATIRQGEQVERADLRIVQVDLDETVPVVPADRIDLLVGQYARTFIAPGTLVVDVMVQPLPLVTAGQGVVAVEIRPTRVPRDLRERSRVFVVVVPEDDDEPLFVAEARVVSAPTRAVTVPPATSCRSRSRSPRPMGRSSRRRTTCGWCCSIPVSTRSPKPSAG
jgi:hypothetical protein